jgi:hypothetical protein
MGRELNTASAGTQLSCSLLECRAAAPGVWFKAKVYWHCLARGCVVTPQAKSTPRGIVAWAPHGCCWGREVVHVCSANAVSMNDPIPIRGALAGLSSPRHSFLCSLVGSLSLRGQSGSRFRCGIPDSQLAACTSTVCCHSLSYQRVARRAKILLPWNGGRISWLHG